MSKEQLDRIESKIDRALSLLGTIVTQGEKNMADITALTADITQETSVEQSLITAFQGLQAQVANLQPTQAAIDALATQIQSNIAAMVAAIPANTPVTPAQMKAKK